jgi:hypothetical protein
MALAAALWYVARFLLQRSPQRARIVISGSNALIKREALVAAGGFDESLRSRGSQGAKTGNLQIAERLEVAVVSEYLIGYRISPGSMSDDFRQMMRSRRMVEVVSPVMV